MASLLPEESVGQNFTWPKPCPPPRKPRVLLAACGCLSAAKFGQICQCFLTWADINTVVTENARVFLERSSFPHNVQMFSDIDQGRVWSESGPLLGSPLPDALSKWADVMVVAPISANTIAKIVGGLCDNLLTTIIRVWDYEKTLYFAPSMDPLMWANPLTERQLRSLRALGPYVIILAGDNAQKHMPDPEIISVFVKINIRVKD
ncbi:phosphopantothenoylcysteine decarboxylase-like [Arachis duranensis]|uniref:phosphopantothenoylcysteine decarboxylase n=1 Tax=Arachis duranensis TaxID=130453 RepID=A0A6P4DE54_ARADU|nr:phosphopantothenoylcysteine decarboxylase-like [Arachis duranensis]